MPQPQPKSAWYFFKEVFHDKINVILLVMMFLFLGLSAFGYGSVFKAMGIGLVVFGLSLLIVPVNFIRIYFCRKRKKSF